MTENTLPENTSPEDDRQDVRHAFAELALITVNGDPAEHTLRRVAELAKRSLGGVGECVSHSYP